jgi:C1A family cysteine protease
MFKKFLCFFITTVYAFSMHGQDKLQTAPLNPDFYLYMKNKTNNSNLNYIPSPLKIKPSAIYDNNYMLEKSLSPMVLPKKFDLRSKNMVTSVKMQDVGEGVNGGNCWAFATMAAVESNWKMRAIGDFDLSEQNMAGCHGFYWRYGKGGNEFTALSYLTRLSGPISESDDPYNQIDTACKEGLSPVAYVTDARIVVDNFLLTKQILMDYGAVYTAICWDNDAFNNTNNTYYYNQIANPNHAVAIVGWDDDKVTDGGKGAWICKNSWGNTWAENGYFYISYRDVRILNPIVYYPIRYAKSEINHIYMYDDLGTITLAGFSNSTAYALTKFTATSSQYIKKIGTFIPTTGSTVDIEIYAEKDGDTLKNLLKSVSNLFCQTPGFYTFDVPVKVTTGDFFVKVKYFTPGINYPIPVEILIDNYAYPAIEDSGKQWISGDGLTWKAMGANIKGWNADLCIRAYTVDKTGPKANFSMSKWEVCAGNTITFTDQSIETINDYTWDFGAEAQPSTATGPGPHQVTFPDTADVGIRFAKLIVNGPDGGDTIVKEYRVVNTLNIQLMTLANLIKVNDTTQIYAIADANHYEWSSVAGLLSDTGKVVNFSANTPTKYRVTVNASQGNCVGTSTMIVEVKQPPVNDNICDAIELGVDFDTTSTLYNNIDATVELREPLPEETDCNAPMKWCDEGGLQCSVWFKFIGPASGKVSIDTRNLDTQIAVYEADNCDTITITKLIAANDDYYPVTKLYAAAIDTLTVKPGQRYYIQVDGSHGGDEGEFDINLYSSPLAIPIVNAKNNLLIYPNPSNGSFELEYSSAITESVNICIYDISGKIISSRNVKKYTADLHESFNLTDKAKGIYFVRLTGNKATQTQKVILK